MKAGVRGISMIFASGDSGADCDWSHDVFVPQGPSSPYITTVGGTKPARNHYPTKCAEVVNGLSSGGFSNYWPQPSWQKAAVDTYLAANVSLPSPSFGYNVSGRAYPDIAAMSSNFGVVTTGSMLVGGTSCAAPTVSGIIALLNDLRLQAGKPTLGFLNPLLYQHPDAFTDVTDGASRGCSSGRDGWPAAQGWDAATGLGTPNYQKLAAVVEALP